MASAGAEAAAESPTLGEAELATLIGRPPATLADAEPDSLQRFLRLPRPLGSPNPIEYGLEASEAPRQDTPT